ncbi:MAG: amidohydrolase [Candidatus Competibacterales bacterium]
MSAITLFRCRQILTMDRNCPEATHVAVRDGRILAVGDADCANPWGGGRVDNRFADCVMVPGLVEAHAHVFAGGIWRYTYCGHYARRDPDGQTWPGVPSNEALVERLGEVAAATPSDQPVVGWGFDPNFVPGRRLDRHHLDQVSTTRPVVVLHSNGHLLTANSTALGAAGIERGSNIEGIARDHTGQPNGELQEFDAMEPVMTLAKVQFSDMGDADGVRAYGRVARDCGVTTVADLFANLDADEVDMLEDVVAEADFPCRYVPAMNAMRDTPEAEVRRLQALKARSTAKLRFGRAKLFTDGAIQGFTAKLKWPGYLTGEDHSILNMTEEHFYAALLALHRAGIQTHIHANGDAASALTIAAIEAALRHHPVADHRHVIEHAQLADRAQFLRMAALGIKVNLFANHLYYFGDIHWTTTLGPDRARRMNACRDALEILGPYFAIHSDAPVTPMAPLFTAWCAVNRITENGRQLGTAQQISVADALHCITLGAAYVLKLDHEVGSIQTGKRADFCLLAQDPLAVDPLALKDVPVVATVLDGHPT